MTLIGNVTKNHIRIISLLLNLIISILEFNRSYQRYFDINQPSVTIFNGDRGK